MARRVTDKEIEQFNNIYYLTHNYSEVARQTGWSASTIKKYIIPNFVPAANQSRVKFDGDKFLAEFDVEVIAKELKEAKENEKDICVLSDEEKAELTQLWEELTV